VSPLLWRSSRRHFLRHPWQLGLAVLGIALGVAVVVGVDLAIASARAAFTLSTQAVTGRATHHVLGGPAGVPETVYRRLRVDAGMRSIAPVVEGWVRLGGGGGGAAVIASDRAPPPTGRVFHLLGLDPFAEAPFRTYVAVTDPSVDLGALLTMPGAVLLSTRAALEHGLAPGDRVELTAGGHPFEGVLVGTIDASDDPSGRALADMMLADIATAQELLGRAGVLDRIDVRAANDESGRVLLDSIRATLTPGLRVVSADARAETIAALAHAFEVNLSALSLLALVFGLFLVYNSMSFSVVQRRPLIGLLRAQGVTRREVFAIILAEALVLAAVATVLGIALGIVLGGGLVRLVARTINDLYFSLSVSGITVTPLTIGKAFGLGVGATLLASVPPAREATSSPPRAALSRSLLESRSRRTSRTAALGGALVLALGMLSFLLPWRSLMFSFAGVFAVLLGGALIAPAATLMLMHLMRPVAGRAFGHLGRMAARGVAASLSRTAPAIAALAIAIAAGLAVGTMIDSFRTTVVAWLDATLGADVYVSAPSSTADRSATPLDPLLAVRIRAVAGVAGVSTYRNVTLPLARGDVRLVAIELFAAHRASFHFIEGNAGEAWPPFEAGEAILVSEAFAYRHRVHAGETLVLPTARGVHEFRIAGVFSDYASEHGVIFMSRTAYDAHWNDAAISSLAVFAAPGVDGDSLLVRLRAVDTGGQEVFFRSDRALRNVTLEVFERTFAVTGVVRLLALAVAFVGVLSALMALQLERAREIGVLRATGLTAGQVWAVVSAQTGLMGLAAGALALPLGALLSWIMVHVVNRRSFGWTIHLEIQPSALAQAIAIAVIAALLAGLYPAYRMSRTPPALALREE
jgi:putative ABC transport system permease protein